MPPTLRRRMILSLGLMALGSLAIGIGAMIAVLRLHQNVGVAVQGYRQLRQLYDAGFLASRAREAMAGNPPRLLQARQALLATQSKLLERSVDDSTGAPPVQWLDESSRHDCLNLVSAAIGELDIGAQEIPSLDLLFARTSKISEDVRRSILDTQTAADHQKQLSLWFILILCMVVFSSAIVIGVRQYRRVIDPIRLIGNGARAFARGEFSHQITLNADREFLALASDFNQMARDLSALYRDLEQKVQDKTRELVRSEQLASVGYLAAGVAHEINNPLGIIAGYGERAIQQLAVGLDADSLPHARKALGIICEEAFRCKQITDRLLSLAQPASESRQVVSMASIAEAVVSTLSGLGTVGQRSLSINTSGEAFQVLAHAGEMKQVLINLIINAIDAVDPKGGKVIIEMSRKNETVQMAVIDDGEGMTSQTLQQVFQPFFTGKRGSRSGTGLGLSIAHAIVTDHGGRIWAQSDGPGTGSTFHIELPLADQEDPLVDDRSKNETAARECRPRAGC